MITRRSITREERDRLATIAIDGRRYISPAGQIRLMVLSLRIAADYRRASSRKIGHLIDQLKWKQYARRSIGDARVYREEAKRYGWRLP